MFCDLEDLSNEADVEQKFLWPLLTSDLQSGLGYLPEDIRCKPSLKKLMLVKGSQKVYHPDYVVVLAGIPILIVEAKSPTAGAIEAIKEARLYATELNSSFPTGINPCRRIITSNGKTTATAPVDNVDPDMVLEFEDVNPTSQQYDQFINLLCRGAMQTIADDIRDALTTRPLVTALQYVGGQTIRNEDVGYNTFGSKLAIEYRHVFNPESRSERSHIVRNAYVTSRRRDRYVDEIDHIIRSTVAATVPGAIPIDDTEKPEEIFRALGAGRSLENQVMLLVGGAGAGKSTFVDYCRSVKLPEKLTASTLWVHVNINTAPSGGELLERYLLEEVALGLKEQHPEIDFDREIQKVFAVEVNKFKKEMTGLLEPESQEYKSKLADRILKLRDDPLKYAQSLSRFLAGERSHGGKLLVIVFDNCDKRERHDQLVAFEAARWLQKQIRCLIVLPIRDITYDTFRDQPPLDTMIKDLVFRIDPPPFTKILEKRLSLVLDELAASNSGKKVLQFKLANGTPVTYPASEVGFYLASLFKSLYRYDRIIRSLLVGLAGRNVRQAMEIFLEFCRSGHIGAAEYLKIKNQKGDYALPYNTVARVLLRRKRRFYNGDDSFVKNLFQCHPQDSKPDPFVRANILSWLRSMYRISGPTGVKGFHACRTLYTNLVPLGHDALRIKSELGYLIQHGCVLTEHLGLEIKSDDDLIRLSPSGFVHLDLLADHSYLAACVEETWVEDDSLAKDIARRIAEFGPKVHFSTVTTAENAARFATYLESKSNSKSVSPESYLLKGFSGVTIDIEKIKRTASKAVSREKQLSGWKDFEERFSEGEDYEGKVVAIKHYGCFVNLNDGPTGLMHVSNIPVHLRGEFKEGQRVCVEIESYDIIAEKMSLRFIKALTE